MESTAPCEPSGQVYQVLGASARMPLAEWLERVQEQTTTQTTSSRMVKNYARKRSTVLGAVQMVCGLLSMLASLATTVTEQVYEEHVMLDPTSLGSAYGTWCGVSFFLAGTFAVAAGRRTNSCLIITSMVLSIVAAVFAGIQVFNGAFGFEPRIPIANVYDGVEHRLAFVTAMTAVLLALGVVQMAVSIWASALCCRVACCPQEELTDVVVQYTIVRQPENPFVEQHPTDNQAGPLETQRVGTPAEQATSRPPSGALHSCRKPVSPSAPAQEDNLAFNDTVPGSDCAKLWVVFDE